jgi:hypothetical protein
LKLFTPKANAVAERWVRTVCCECLDQLLILNRRYLAKVLKEYAHDYDTVSASWTCSASTSSISYAQHGSILHDYYHDTA